MIKKRNEGASTQKKLQLQIGLFLSRITMSLCQSLLHSGADVLFYENAFTCKTFPSQHIKNYIDV